MRLAPVALLGLLLAPVTAFADGERDAADGTAQLTAAIRAHDAKTIAKHLRAPITTTGMWFADPGCTKRYGAPQMILGKETEGLARCLAQLKLQMSTRKSGLREGTILTYEPGIELELVFDGNAVRWIGFESQITTVAAPTLTTQAFEALRTAGTTLLDDALRPELEAAGQANQTESVWFKVCLDATGAVTSAKAGSTTPIAQALSHAIGDWRFQPFKVRGTALPVCTLTQLTYPAAKAPPVETLPTANVPMASRVTPFDDDDEWGELELMGISGYSGGTVGGSIGGPPPPPPSLSPQTVTPTSIEALRISGNRQIVPDARTKTKMLAQGKDKVIASFKLCLDPRGAVASVSLLKSSGYPEYDKTITTEMQGWRYKPYRINGAAVPVCTAVSFIFATK